MNTNNFLMKNVVKRRKTLIFLKSKMKELKNSYVSQKTHRKLPEWMYLQINHIENGNYFTIKKKWTSLLTKYYNNKCKLKYHKFIFQIFLIVNKIVPIDLWNKIFEFLPLVIDNNERHVYVRNKLTKKGFY